MSSMLPSLPPRWQRSRRDSLEEKGERAMRNADAFAGKITKWELLVASLEPLLETLPYLEPLHGRLQGLIEQARELDLRQEAARSEVRELTRERQDVEREGENVRARTSAHLRATYGFTSEELIRFGVNPRPSGRRRPATDPPEPGTVSPQL